ncbi:TPA: Rrf2 family transcriptional regulator [Streptococcus suis]|nr:Rrf2 family transcriptional regulator [Streptococcus suis]
MQLSSRFTIASHILVLLALEGDKEKQTSTSIAGSVGVNPVIIRNILAQLREAGLVQVARGVGGARLAQAPEQITLLHVYQAVELFGENGQLFGFHEQPNPNCQVGRNIHPLLDSRLENAQSALERELGQTTIADLLAEL